MVMSCNRHTHRVQKCPKPLVFAKHPPPSDCASSSSSFFFDLFTSFSLPPPSLPPLLPPSFVPRGSSSFFLSLLYSYPFPGGTTGPSLATPGPPARIPRSHWDPNLNPLSILTSPVILSLLQPTFQPMRFEEHTRYSTISGKATRWH